MCANGVNTGQFEQMITQIDEHVALERKWAHRLAHQAEDAAMPKTGELLHQAQAALDEARALLAEAKDAIEEDASAASGVSVSLV